MTPARVLCIAALTAATLAAVAVAGRAAPAQQPGVTDTEILIGGTVPLTGEASAFGSVGQGARAYFDHVNDGGGVHGRSIRYLTYNDAYNPAQTVFLTRRLVEEDGVFAIFNTVGTANNLAIRDYLNILGVPQLFSGDGSDAVGRTPSRFPWTMGFLPSYRGEGAVYGRELARAAPKARIAVLFENTELGRDMHRGLAGSLRGKGPRIVATQSYELSATDVAGQMAKLKASRADTLMLFATPKFMIQAVVAAHRLRWKPRVVIASISIEPGIMAIARSNAPELTRGALSVAFLKNPNDPVWAKDPALALYRKILAEHAPDARPSDAYLWYGMTVAWAFVDALRRAGPSPTRESLLQAAQSIDTGANPFLLPGIRMKTSPTDYYPLETVYLYRYDNKEWVKASALLRAG